MLTEERYSIITETVNREKSVGINTLCELLGASVSTVRRDLNALDEMGKIVKVHGGAVAVNDETTQLEPFERNVEEKSALFTEEKAAIAAFASQMIENGDFVFIDAGTTTAKLIELLPKRDATFVTNAFTNAKMLARRGFRVFLPGGEIKPSTEAIIGSECLMSLKKYNFTKCFLGANGISIKAGVTTPDINEARIKEAVIQNSSKSFILADHSKFDKVASVTFAQIFKVQIITDRIPDKKYAEFKTIKEVL